MATSANFGNMFSMAGASLFLSFLPLLPKQVLLTNLLTDFPEMTIASDNVDPEMLAIPRRWDIRFIMNFMLVFGVLSSVFDYATFGVLLLVLHAGPGEFRTGWFIESVSSAALIVLVIRTRRPFFRSVPNWRLLVAMVLVVAAVIAIPFTPLRALRRSACDGRTRAARIRTSHTPLYAIYPVMIGFWILFLWTGTNGFLHRVFS